VKFRRKEGLSLTNGRMVEWVDSDRIVQSPLVGERVEDGAFMIVATEMGVRLQGTSPHLASPDDFSNLAKAIGDASKEFLAMRPKIQRGGLPQ
jgi:hypothetical protein